MFSICLCARFQKASKTSHLEAVKRIFRYIKGTTHLGLWYPKGTGIERVVYAKSDHAGDYVDRKSTSGICTFMGCCLTSWFSKKQTALVKSTTEAEYVSAGKAYQQALWMKQALIDYDVRLDDEGTLSLGNGDGGNEKDELKKIGERVKGDHEKVRRLGKEIDDKEAELTAFSTVVSGGVGGYGVEDYSRSQYSSNGGVDGRDRRALMRTNSKIGSVTYSNTRPYQPYQHLSASVVDNNHYGVGGYVEKEKKTLKANQYYQNSNLKMLKGIFLDVKKKFETAVGVLCQEKITLDPEDPAVVDQYAKVMKTIYSQSLKGSDSPSSNVLMKSRIRVSVHRRKRLQLLLFAISGKVEVIEDDASSEEDKEDVVDEAVVEKLIKVNPPRVSPDGSESYLSETMYGALGKKRVPKADASPPV
uniref:Uncharacterized mitochondrial protein AtMg00810-like n=1 Tax=Tanacetum cinerariifolium TaxID=118510 RepID=A0A6L2P6M6_TANCI|nr:uncharacterized mitochondrial protein AtMg00810-like [Tanacetum cinerariifolium]